MSDDKCPPSEIKIEKGSISVGTDVEGIKPLTDKIEGKGLSQIFYRCLDRGNLIPDMTSTEKSVHWLQALKEAGIECKDLIKEWFEIHKKNKEFKSYMDLINPILEEYKTHMSTFFKTGKVPVGTPNFNMKEITVLGEEIGFESMELNIKILDRLNEGLTKVYGKEATALTKMLIEGEL